MSVDWNWLANYSQNTANANAAAQAQQAQAQSAVQQFLQGTQPPLSSQQANAQAQQAGQGNAQRVAGANAQRRQARQDSGADKAYRGLRAFANQRERISNLPTPGGIGALVLILIVLLFVIVPVNGNKTRLGLLWDVSLGQAKLPKTGSGSGPIPDAEGGTGSGPTPDPAQPTGQQSGAVSLQNNNVPQVQVISPAPWDYSPTAIPMPGVMS